VNAVVNAAVRGGRPLASSSPARMRARVCARVCACVRVCARVCASVATIPVLQRGDGGGWMSGCEWDGMTWVCRTIVEPGTTNSCQKNHEPPTKQPTHIISAILRRRVGGEGAGTVASELARGARNGLAPRIHRRIILSSSDASATSRPLAIRSLRVVAVLSRQPPRSLGASEPRSLGASEPRSLGASEPRSLGASEPRSLGDACDLTRHTPKLPGMTTAPETSRIRIIEKM
jgi:hypothetical protein